ncbi:hypothetical protein Patl1_13299 [Pistacia atlantica]|uniref:Uncharacterized protein n=1 Tax=Pistacia atlantica TaxID=434234 RepID=A0ACC1AYB3_9ROSI|nr:hypothetical protein Patl1_13299 [Pistacia atlantica]
MCLFFNWQEVLMGPHAADITEHIRSSNVTGPGTRVHFRSPMGKHLSPDYTVDKNIVSDAHMPSTSYSLAGASKRNTPKPVIPTEASNPGHGHSSKVGPSSSWISSLQRISSAK